MRPFNSYQGNKGATNYTSGSNSGGSGFQRRPQSDYPKDKENSHPHKQGGSAHSVWTKPPKKYSNSKEEGGGDLSDYRAQMVLNRMVRCNTLTIGSQKSPEYYLKLIRYHFIKSEEPVLSLQALGSSCQNLIYTACLLTMKGYASYKRIKNDHLSVPIADSKTGAHIGLIKKVRLTVKLTKSEHFAQLIQQEELRQSKRFHNSGSKPEQQQQYGGVHSSGKRIYNDHILSSASGAKPKRYNDLDGDDDNGEG